MERTSLLNKTKIYDTFALICLFIILIFSGILIYYGLLTAPFYAYVTLGGLWILTFITVVSNINGKQAISNSYNEVCKSILQEKFEVIKNKKNNEYNDIAKYYALEIEGKNDIIKQILKYVKAIEKEEPIDLVLNTKNNDVKYIFNTLRLIEREKVTSQLVNNEFFRNIKTGKFNKIEIDEDNITEQQLNKVLDILYTMNINLRIVHTALYEGNFKLELNEENMDGDFLNITNKFKTLLKAVELSTNNLNTAINNIYSENLLEFIKPAVKGNQLINFKAIENIHIKLVDEIENISKAIDMGNNIDEENKGIFLPIVKSLNNLKKSLNKYESNEYKDNISYCEEKTLIEDIESQLEELENVINLQNTIPDLVIEENSEIVSEDYTQELEEREEEQFLDKTQKYEFVEENNVALDVIEEVIEETDKKIKEVLEDNIEALEINTQNTSQDEIVIDMSQNKKHHQDIILEERVVSDITEKRKSKSKEPLTYQQALANGDMSIYEKNTSNFKVDAKKLNNKKVKEPLTYQKFLQSEDSEKIVKPKKNTVDFEDDFDTSDSVRKLIGEAKDLLKHKPTSKSKDESKNNKNCSSNTSKIHRELSKRDRAEIDLYGEVLDDNIRKDIDVITRGNDLGGF